MTIEQLTKGPTETDLEVQLDQAIRLAFPWLANNAVHHQLSFKVQIGRTEHEVDGSKKSYQARADAIVYQGDHPLAVLELKRHDQALTPGDELQGLSYAKLHNPSPPLVIITNGADVKIIATHTGKPWVPESETEDALKAYLESASKVAKGNLKEAVESLMGTAPAVWMPAVRHETQQRIASRTGPWSDPSAPFVEGWGIPRAATTELIDKALSGTKLTLLVGAPLSGKSNVFREVCETTANHPNLAALYLEAGSGVGVLQALADTLSHALGWPIEPNEARTWLTNVSKSAEDKLLLLIDDVSPDDESRRTLEDLISHRFGPGLIIAVAANESAAERLCQSTNLLSASAIGRLAETVALGSLSDAEFDQACQSLQKLRIKVLRGADASRELREPWVIRSVTRTLVETVAGAPEDHFVCMPPQLSLNLIAEARDRFTTPELLRIFQAMAKAVLDDAQNTNRGLPLQLESLDSFLVQRSTLKRHLDPDEIAKASSIGLLSEAIHSGDTPVFYVRVPDLLASELAKLVTKALADVDVDSAAAIKFLENVASHFPIGDIIAAQGLLDAMLKGERFPISIITGLLARPPRSRAIEPGTKIALKMPTSGVVNISYKGKGNVEVNHDGDLATAVLGERELGSLTDDFYPWLILSLLPLTEN
ncbi:hypothetical protein IPC1147_33525 [Pseudomonas aeruginosa]|uniref:type I restriction endonuclease n=1 Tax=Pseudomonas aeruginosa TaxID=287 RepID=UPI001003119D|nr:type I restriction endonuclease [Pseudomonas aeruginosa]NPS41206.1 hypothetical protein [Pseudomonas aeruginosa]NPS90508.1 hypothetical protein [Pseudomonas aeruginosa]RRS16525.1 hypothetical protein IPC1107_33600 [Pseudomonas aeruginosa]RRS17949.1 hypothetical protein IPC1147_33525 [Pseudomonas aeruginosa]HBN8626690.1 hypothetical protein [Pseudomonas aeruginosa]